MNKTTVICGVCVAAGLLLLATAFAFAAGKTTTALSADGADVQEVTFGDLATDALCDKTGAAIAFMPAVSFKRGTIPAGPVTGDKVSALLQNPDEAWAVGELTGDQIKQALERSVSHAPVPNGVFLQVSGLSLTYSPNGGAAGRVKSVLVGGAALDETRKYDVAMPLSLAKGGSGYFQIFDEGCIRVRGADAIAGLVTNYVAARGTVSYTGQGRIRQQ